MVLLLIYMDGIFIGVLLGYTCKVLIVISNLFHHIIVFLNVLTKLLYLQVTVLHHECIVYCFRDLWIDQVHIFKILAVFLLLLFLTVCEEALLI